MTVYYLKDLLNGRKRKLKNDQIQTVYVPMYENLTLKHIGAFASQQADIADYLPDQEDLPKTPKQWICNVCAAVIGEPFRAWVKQQVEERNAAMADKRDMMIAMDPEMAAKFKASTHVSRKFEFCLLIRSS